jgi:hypothetical protein
MSPRVVGTMIVAVFALGTVGSSGVTAAAQQDHVTFCHATGSKTNPYVMISPSVSGTYHGHYLHHGGDIIPPFEYQGETFSLNWDVDGRTTFQNGCVPTAAPAPPEVQGVPPVRISPNFTG